MHKGSRSMQKANQLFAYVKCTKECILYKRWIDFSVYIAQRIVYSTKKKKERKWINWVFKYYHISYAYPISRLLTINFSNGWNFNFVGVKRFPLYVLQSIFNKFFGIILTNLSTINAYVKIKRNLFFILNDLKAIEFTHGINRI